MVYTEESMEALWCTLRSCMDFQEEGETLLQTEMAGWMI